jgi:type I restriction enzyme S subunit
VNSKTNWQTARLKDLPIEFIDGDRSSRYPKRDEFVPEGILFLNAESISEGYLNLDKVNYISEEKFATIKKDVCKKAI